MKLLISGEQNTASFLNQEAKRKREGATRKHRPEMDCAVFEI